jgi:hypothetical protein
VKNEKNLAVVKHSKSEWKIDHWKKVLMSFSRSSFVYLLAKAGENIPANTPPEDDQAKTELKSNAPNNVTPTDGS